MAVLWRNNENTNNPDASYDGTHKILTGTFADKNTFLEKHVRVFPQTLPDEQTLKSLALDVYNNRRKGPATKVKSVAGPERRKDDLFGANKPPKSTVFFVDLKGFQETNAYIEKFVAKSAGHQLVPILGGGTVVTYDGTNYSVVKAGNLVLGIRVGAVTNFKIGSQTGTMQSKIVYHLDGVK